MIKRSSVIILGNGFDIAHNFPTRYSNFADYLLNTIYEELIEYRKGSIIRDSFWKFKDNFQINGYGDNTVSFPKNRTV